MRKDSQFGLPGDEAPLPYLTDEVESRESILNISLAIAVSAVGGLAVFAAETARPVLDSSKKVISGLPIINRYLS